MKKVVKILGTMGFMIALAGTASAERAKAAEQIGKDSICNKPVKVIRAFETGDKEKMKEIITTCPEDSIGGYVTVGVLAGLKMNESQLLDGQAPDMDDQILRTQPVGMGAGLGLSGSTSEPKKPAK